MEGEANTTDGGGGGRGEPDITLPSEGIVNQIGTRGRGRCRRKKTLKGTLKVGCNLPLKYCISGVVT